MEMRSGNCITNSKRPYLRNPSTPVGEDTLGDPMTVFGKDAPFQGGKGERTVFHGRQQPTCAEARTPMRLRGRCWHSVACTHMHPPASPEDHSLHMGLLTCGAFPCEAACDMWRATCRIDGESSDKIRMDRQTLRLRRFPKWIVRKRPRQVARGADGRR